MPMTFRGVVPPERRVQAGVRAILPVGWKIWPMVPVKAGKALRRTLAGAPGCARSQRLFQEVSPSQICCPWNYIRECREITRSWPLRSRSVMTPPVRRSTKKSDKAVDRGSDTDPRSRQE